MQTSLMKRDQIIHYYGIVNRLETLSQAMSIGECLDLHFINEKATLTQNKMLWDKHFVENKAIILEMFVYDLYLYFSCSESAVPAPCPFAQAGAELVFNVKCWQFLDSIMTRLRENDWMYNVLPYACVVLHNIRRKHENLISRDNFYHFFFCAVVYAQKMLMENSWTNRTFALLICGHATLNDKFTAANLDDLLRQINKAEIVFLQCVGFFSPLKNSTPALHWECRADPASNEYEVGSYEYFAQAFADNLFVPRSIFNPYAARDHLCQCTNMLQCRHASLRPL